jgi:hypothetical protein
MNNHTDLISPMAAGQSPRRSATHPRELFGQIVLSDSMLNFNAGWGALILDSVEAAILESISGSTSPGGVSITRISRPQIGEHRPHEWIDHLVADNVAAVVVTAGDCATCTSRALRECILAEEAGIPATAVVPQGLSEIIHATLRSWGRPDLRIATFETPLFALKRDDFPEVMQSTATAVISILTSP